jgi:hypothetical protein
MRLTGIAFVIAIYLILVGFIGLNSLFHFVR